MLPLLIQSMSEVMLLQHTSSSFSVHSAHLFLFNQNQPAERRPSWTAVKCWYQIKKRIIQVVHEGTLRQSLLCIVWKETLWGEVQEWIMRSVVSPSALNEPQSVCNWTSDNVRHDPNNTKLSIQVCAAPLLITFQLLHCLQFKLFSYLIQRMITFDVAWLKWTLRDNYVFIQLISLQ